MLIFIYVSGRVFTYVPSRCKTFVARQPTRSLEFSQNSQEEMFCDEFHLVDLRVYENCKTVVKGCDHVFNLAADMGGKQAVFSLYYTAFSVLCLIHTVIEWSKRPASCQ